MYKQIYKFSAVLLIGFYLSGCQAITGETLGQNIDDTTITTTVKSKLAVDKASSLTRVGVDTRVPCT